MSALSDPPPEAELDASPAAPLRLLRACAPSVVAAVTVLLFAKLGVSAPILLLGAACGVVAGVATAYALSTPPAPLIEEPPRAPPPPPPRPALTGEQALRLLPAPLILLNGQGRVDFANAAAEEMIGRSLADQHYSAALRAPGVVDAVNRAFLDGAPSEFEFSLRGANERHFRAHVRPLSEFEGDDAKLEGKSDAKVLVLIEDHTRAKRAEQLHRDFVANASHELKTPLASIAGFVETLRGPAKGDDAAHERFLPIMAQQADRMRALVEDLLSLNRIELNEHVAPRDTVDLDAIVRDAAASAEPDPKAGAPRIGLRLPDDMPEVLGDARELTQVFENLLQNALKYGGDGKPVLVTSAVSDDRGRFGVSVVDQGRGIAREHLPRLTERFYRVDVPASRDKGGTGLGLAIVKHILNRHRGELEIDSELGRGSRFTVWLPVVETTAKRPGDDSH